MEEDTRPRCHHNVVFPDEWCPYCMRETITRLREENKTLRKLLRKSLYSVDRDASDADIHGLTRSSGNLHGLAHDIRALLGGE